MLKYITAMTILAAFTQVASAQWYYHTKMKDMMQPMKIDEAAGTAIYQDPYSYEKITIQLADLVKETKQSINGVKQGKLSVVNYPHHKYCRNFHVFENGMTYTECYVSSYKDQFGRTIPGNAIRYFDHVNNHIGEVAELGDLKKGDRVVLTKTYGDINEGKEVTIEALFPNGEALVYWRNIIFIANTKPLKPYSRVQISDLLKQKE